MSWPEGFSPPPDAHRHPIVVEEGDVDELGHVNNVRWVRFVIDAAVSHSSALGLDLAAYLALGVVWVVRQQQIDYLRPARLGERLTIVTWVHSVALSSSVRRTVVVREPDRRPLLTATTTWVMVDRAGRPTPVPGSVRERFAAGASRPPASAPDAPTP